MADRKLTITVIGASRGGIHVAGHLGPNRAKLRMHDRDEARLTELRAKGGIQRDGEGGGFVELEKVTANLAEAVEGADIIVVCTGGVPQEGLARDLAPLLRDGQLILLIQGNTGGAIVVRRALDAAGCRVAVDVAEMDNYPHSGPMFSPSHIGHKISKKGLRIATFPGNRIDAVFPRLGPLFPTAVAAPNIVHTSLMNANAMLHVANCIANASNIDRGVAYKFYAEGVTPMVARVYEAINAERVAVAAAFGVTVPDLAGWWERSYGVREKTLPETAIRLTTDENAPYRTSPTPKSFDDQFISEDVPTGLIPISALGDAAGVATPAIDALIELSKHMSGTNFADSARTLERMGLAGKDISAIKRILESGFSQA